MNKIYFLLGLFIVLLTSCASMSDAYLKSNIKYVSYEGAVNGMTNVSGYTTQVGYAWSIDEIGRMAANGAAQKGWHDITILVRLIQQGGGGYIYGRNVYGSTGTQSVVEITFWQ